MKKEKIVWTAEEIVKYHFEIIQLPIVSLSDYITKTKFINPGSRFISYSAIEKMRDEIKNKLGHSEAPYYGHHYLPDGSMPDYSEDGYLLHKEVLDLINKEFDSILKGGE